MRLKLTILLIALMVALPTLAGTTNYVTRSASIGTHEQVIPTTSALWRAILPTETTLDALAIMGITNDATGALYLTNGASGTNAAGRYVAQITSQDGSIVVRSVSTNSNGGMTVDLSADLINIIGISSGSGFDSTSIQGGYDMVPVVQGSPNVYWLDCGKTNSFGQKLIYASLTATNDVEFIGPTNCSKWSTLSFNVTASGGDRNILLPSTYPHLDTNGLVLTNGVYQLTLTNGNEFRMTLQSNQTLSTLWTTFGQ